MGTWNHRSNRQIRWLSALLSVLMLIMMLLPTPAAAAMVPDEPLVIDMPGRQLKPMTDGRYVVWSQERPEGGAATDVFAARLSDGVVFPVRTGGHGATPEAISDGVVIWTESPDCSACRQELHGVFLDSRESFLIAGGEGTDVYRPDIAGDFVVWAETSAEGSLIRGRSITGDSAPTTIAVLRGTARQVATDGARVVWEDSSPGGDESRWAIYVRDLVGEHQEPLLLLEGTDQHPGPGSSYGFDLANHVLAVMTYIPARLHVFDLSSGTSRWMNVAGYSQQVTTDGQFVIWEEPQGNVLQGYDLLSDSGFRIGEATVVAAAQPNLANGILVWLSGDGDVNAVHASWLIDLLPTAPTSDSGSGFGTYFPETGHALGGDFDRFWHLHGGLPVFGYALTSEFLRPGQIDDWGNATMVPTQFTERQRFEWHQEHAGTPYEVLLGRLGAELLIAQGRDWTAFPKADPAFPYYMPETGQAIDARFHDYWSSHGLDMGDAGVSFRESLALFGFPISPVMEETNADGDIVLTQYFERAVFEWHPEHADTPYEVLLRRVGVDLLVGYGWMQLPPPSCPNAYPDC